jgi:glycosyltransferase involved in cell wall biosynthesis
MQDNILVSIICNTYNHENYIADAIEGFLMQKTDFHYEILIHDDASTDKTADIIREYEKRHPDLIKPIYQTENQYSRGVKVSRFSRERAIGKYIAVCEGDDYWIDPQKLQKQVDYMETNDRCTLCFHSAELVDKDKVYLDTLCPYTYDRCCTVEDVLCRELNYPTASMMYLKEAYDNIPQHILKRMYEVTASQLFLTHSGYAYYINSCMSAYRTNVSVSWTNNVYKNKDRYLEHHRRMLDMYQCFNEYSNFKYADAVSKAVLKEEFNAAVHTLNYPELKKEKYYELYNALSKKDKLRIRYPDIYDFLKKIKALMKNLKIG